MGTGLDQNLNKFLLKWINIDIKGIIDLIYQGFMVSLHGVIWPGLF